MVRARLGQRSRAVQSRLVYPGEFGAAGRRLRRSRVVVNDEDSRNASSRWIDTVVATGMTTPTPQRPERPSVTIGFACYAKNRMGVECNWSDVKCRFGGMKSEQRFKFRHMVDVSIRVLAHVPLVSK
jgi:hypothetical protein